MTKPHSTAKARRETRLVRAKAVTPIGTVELIQSHWTETADITGISDRHHLQLSVMPEVRGSCATFLHRGGSERWIQMGEMFLLPAGYEVRTIAQPHVQRTVSCVLDPSAVRGYTEMLTDLTDARLQALMNIVSPTVRNLLFRIGQELRVPRAGANTMIDLMLRQVILELARYLSDVDDHDTGGGLPPWRMRLIDERLHRGGPSPTLSELADLCNLSVRHLTRAFRASTSRSIGSYIAEQRLERAKLLLLSGMPVKDVAAQLRFTAAGNFTAAFRRTTGETPRDFLRRRLAGAVR